MANNETIPEREETMIAMAEAAAVKQHEYIHGGEQDDVLTESGPVPTIAKQARLNGQKTDAALEDVADKVSKLTDYQLSEESYLRPVQDRLRDQVSLEDYFAAGDGITNDDLSIALLEFRYSGRCIDLGGKTYLLSVFPKGNAYINGKFLIDGTLLDAHQDATSIGSATDTGGLENAYGGGVNGTPTEPGRSSFFNRVLIASSNCRAMFVRSAVIASIYTWVRGNVAFAAAARQCVVNGPQASAISSEECQSFGFRAFHYASVFCKATVSSGGTIASRLGNVAGSYVAILTSNTCRIGKGKNAYLRPVVVDGVVVSVNIIDGGIGHDLATASLSIQDRSASGSGASGTLVLDGAGTIIGIKDLIGGSNYSQNTDAQVNQVEAQAAIIASELCTIHTGKNVLIGSSLNTEVSGSQAAAIASDSCKVSGSRGSAISAIGSVASGLGSVVLGAVNCQSIADRAVVLGRRVIADLAGSFVIGEALTGVAATMNKIFQVTAAGFVTAKAAFNGNTIYVDYAEYFENYVSGVVLPLGLIVTLKGRHVVPAQEGDYILGVVSGTALIRAGDSPLYWSKRHMTGKFGEPLFETVEVVSWPGVASYDGELAYAKANGMKVPEGANFSVRSLLADDPETAEVEYQDVEWVTWEGYEGFDGALSWCNAQGLSIPKDATYSVQQQNVENPEFDPTLPNTPRSERPGDWSCIGVMGQVHVRVAENVKPGDCLSPNNGIGMVSESETRMRCMEIREPFDSAEGYAVALCFIR